LGIFFEESKDGSFTCRVGTHYPLAKKNLSKPIKTHPKKPVYMPKNFLFKNQLFIGFFDKNYRFTPKTTQ
jgi:hypothetical protein